MAIELGLRRLLVFDGNLEAGVVETDLAVATGDALESIRIRVFVKFGRRADAVLYGRKSFLIVIVVVAIAIFGDACVPSGLTMK